MEHGRWRWGMDGHDFGAWAAASVAALPPSHHQHKHKLVWLCQAALESKSNTSNTSPALPQLQAQLDRRLDNWDIAAIDMEVAALTATSKLLIAALRDDFHVSPPHPPTHILKRTGTHAQTQDRHGREKRERQAQADMARCLPQVQVPEAGRQAGNSCSCLVVL